MRSIESMILQLLRVQVDWPRLLWPVSDPALHMHAKRPADVLAPPVAVQTVLSSVLCMRASSAFEIRLSLLGKCAQPFHPILRRYYLGIPARVADAIGWGNATQDHDEIAVDFMMKLQQRTNSVRTCA